MTDADLLEKKLGFIESCVREPPKITGCEEPGAICAHLY